MCGYELVCVYMDVYVHVCVYMCAGSVTRHRAVCDFINGGSGQGEE